MGISSISSSNEAYLQKLLARQAQSEDSSTTDGVDSDSTDAMDSTAQTSNYDILELSGNSVSGANKALLGSDERNYDSLDLSDEAQQYLNTQSAASEQAPASSGTDQTDSSGETSATENLSLYTEEQLKKLLEEGEITQTDYNSEIAKRQAEEAQKEALAQEDQQTATVTN